MDESEFNRRSCTSPHMSQRVDATPTARGFTAGGSGAASTEAIANNRPRTQIKHDLDFIPAVHQGTHRGHNVGSRPVDEVLQLGCELRYFLISFASLTS
jgi:hypothetical protein